MPKTLLEELKEILVQENKSVCPLAKCPLLQCPAIEQPKPEYGTFTDPRDGREYRTVRIGKQTWLAENLAFDYAGSKVYNNDLANLAKYGRLYDWETAKKAVPPGWHLPSNDEWDELYHFADGTPNEGGKHDSKTAGRHLKAKEGWNSGGNGLDTYGFSALPGGYGSSDGYFDGAGGYGSSDGYFDGAGDYGSSDGYFDGAGDYGDWWSSSEHTANSAYYRNMIYNSEDAYWNYNDKSLLQSVRCLQDLEGKQ